MNTPWPTWLSLEIALQRTVYAPFGSRRSETATARGFPGTPRAVPETSVPASSYTRMPFGSVLTFWSNESVTTRGDWASR